MDADRDGIADANDCAPGDATAWQMLEFVARNDDGDSRRVNVAGRICAGAALPANRFATAAPAGEVDCDDTNAAKWTLTPYASRDLDGDGLRANVAGEDCGGGGLPANLFAQAVAQNLLDCDDADASRWELRNVYRDRDGDGVGAGPPVLQCAGTGALQAGYVKGGYDPNDDPNDVAAASAKELAIDSAMLVTPDDTRDLD